VPSLEEIFPRLRPDTYQVTSPPTDDYNCIAWSAERDDLWWWPDEMETSYWPPGVPRAATVEAFLQAYARLGYEPCPTSDLEEGLEKIAVYTDANGVPTHAARQLVDGTWTSKLGSLEDITHSTLGAVTNETYGTATLFLRRPCSIPRAGAGDHDGASAWTPSR
jgi:hypothetical protein